MAGLAAGCGLVLLMGSRPLPSALLGVSEPRAPLVTSWQVGSCHQLEQPELLGPSVGSDTSLPVPCEQAHQSETFATASLTGAIAREAERPDPVQLRPLSAQLCSRDALNRYLGSGPYDGVTAIDVVVFFPTVAEWRAGMRTARCDALPQPVDGAAVPSISEPVHNVLDVADGARFRRCRVGDVETTCDRNHSREFIPPWLGFSRAQLAQGPQRVQAAGTAVCTAQAERYMGSALSEHPDLILEVDTPHGVADSESTIGSCWVGPAKQTTLVTGSVHGFAEEKPAAPTDDPTAPEQPVDGQAG